MLLRNHISKRFSVLKNLPHRDFRAAVVLSGCGVADGSEITEAVSLLIALSKHGARYMCFAPNRPQMHVVNHINGTPTQDKRNILEESARIARGVIKDIKDLDASHYDAVFLPGGFGAAKNLSDFAVKGPDMTV